MDELITYEALAPRFGRLHVPRTVLRHHPAAWMQLQSLVLLLRVDYLRVRAGLNCEGLSMLFEPREEGDIVPWYTFTLCLDGSVEVVQAADEWESRVILELPQAAQREPEIIIPRH